MSRPNPVKVSPATPLTLTILLAAALVAASAGHAQIEPRRPHSKDHAQAMSTDGPSARIVVKFHQGTGVRLGAGGLYVDAGYPRVTNPFVPRLGRAQVEADAFAVEATARSEGFEIGALVVDDLASLDQWKAGAEAYLGREVADLSLYFQILMKDWGKGHDLRRLVAELNELPSLEIAYAEPVASPMFGEKIATPPPSSSCGPDDVNFPAPDFQDDQDHLEAAPVGVDALTAWTYAGGRGSGIRVVDIEAGYGDHVDHPAPDFTTGHKWSPYLDHSRAVIGILAALDNGQGTTGIAGDVHFIVRSIYNGNLFGDWGDALMDSFNVAYNIYWAGKHSLGGVVLLELQRPGPEDENCPCSPSGCIAVPVEYYPADYDHIEAAVGNGVVVVEAAGNGSHNLDSVVFGNLFDRTFRDSGAILTSGSHAYTREPMCAYGRPNSGSRVDVHSWGELIVTTGKLNPKIWDDGACNSYTSDFGGSSGASAIVAGVAASLQGVALANLGSKLDPLALRQLLVATGTPQAPGPNGELIGPQPDLAAAITELLP